MGVTCCCERNEAPIYRPEGRDHKDERVYFPGNLRLVESAFSLRKTAVAVVDKNIIKTYNCLNLIGWLDQVSRWEI